MQQIQILLPIYDNQGEYFNYELFAGIKTTLVEKYGGITAYTRSPAKGLWKENKNKVIHDDIVIYEVMVERLDLDFWRKYKEELKIIFAQDEVVIRATEIILI